MTGSGVLMESGEDEAGGSGRRRGTASGVGGAQCWGRGFAGAAFFASQQNEKEGGDSSWTLQV